jgi:ribosomal protein S3
MGSIGIKVWINRGEIFDKGLNAQIKPNKFILPERKKFNKDGKKGVSK